MNGRNFSLRALRDYLPLNSEKLEIRGNIMRSGGTLSISFKLSGPPDVLTIPAPAISPARKSALWEETCFELFLAERESDPYWEFNMSPAGHWNVYCFTAYRQGMSESPAFSSLPLVINSRPGLVHLSLEVDLTKIEAAEKPLDAGVSAVIKTRDGSRTCWALLHPGPHADFHRRDSFVVAL